ncbi:IclR family transcriptional regulator [Actinomadura decatromicini]|uniref:IclR family transcriptional regulator n=1 Tax=Actinomadura decatromicini TaxID=2604572 RepID=A0A5D3FT65_9ACTN|nr:IclR family transcriptional regulator [Actinomadura decatromicini]TYK51299.1 IclR family transcriptional regulator [Actinomadura decatromicini]
MDKPLKTPPPYAVASVDNALRIAAMLQLEGPMTVTEVAGRLGVAGSTAHRLLAMLVYRDFAVQQQDRSYRVGPVLELAAHSQSAASRLRAAALPHLRRLVDLLDESANLAVRTGDTVRFIASVESSQAVRVGSREGMVFHAHRTTGGLLLLAELPPDELDDLYRDTRRDAAAGDRPVLADLKAELARVRRNGFAVNDGRSERGLVAVGVPVRDPDGTAVAGLSVSMPSIRYEKERLPRLVATLRTAASALERNLQTT